ncbi:hypothetical protein ACRBEV_32935 (plasmid) [Methylobacterium phyllosphaerae]
MSDFDRSLTVSPTRQRSLMQFGMAVLYIGAIATLVTIAPRRTPTEQQLAQDTTLVISQRLSD